MAGNKTTLRTWGLALTLLGGACGADRQSEMRLFCNPPEAPKKEMMGVAFWLDSNLKRPETRALLQEFGNLPPGETARLLRSAANEAGVAPCPLADELERRAGE